MGIRLRPSINIEYTPHPSLLPPGRAQHLCRRPASKAPVVRSPFPASTFPFISTPTQPMLVPGRSSTPNISREIGCRLTGWQIYKIVLNTLAVGSINSGSILIVASYVIQRPPVLEKVLSFEKHEIYIYIYIYISYMIILFFGDSVRSFFFVSASVCDSRNWNSRSISFVRAPSSGGGSNAPRPAVPVPHLDVNADGCRARQARSCKNIACRGGILEILVVS